MFFRRPSALIRGFFFLTSVGDMQLGRRGRPPLCRESCRESRLSRNGEDVRYGRPLKYRLSLKNACEPLPNQRPDSTHVGRSMLAFFSCAIPKWCCKQLVTLGRETKANGVYSSSVYDTLHMPGFEMAFFRKLPVPSKRAVAHRRWVAQFSIPAQVRVAGACLPLVFHAFGRFVLF